MAAAVMNIDWSPLQVASSMLTSNAIWHAIIGDVALMHYGATSPFHPEFSIEVCVYQTDMSKAVDVLKSSKLFQDVPDHVITQSCYEGTIAYSRLQTVWNASQRRNIIILPHSVFLGTLFVRNAVSSSHKETRLLGLSEKDVTQIPFEHHDQLAALAAKRLFDTGKVSETWLESKQTIWGRRRYNLVMAIIGKTVTTDAPIQVAPNNEKNHATVDGDGNGQKRKMVTLRADETSAKREKKDGN